MEKGRNREKSERVHQQKYKDRSRNTGGKEDKNQWKEGDSHSKAGKLKRQERADEKEKGAQNCVVECI